MNKRKYLLKSDFTEKGINIKCVDTSYGVLDYILYSKKGFDTLKFPARYCEWNEDMKKLGFLGYINNYFKLEDPIILGDANEY